MDAAGKLDQNLDSIEFEELSIEQMLQTCLLFKEMKNEDLIFVSNLLEENFFKKGEPIFLENEINDTVYFVKSGAVELVHYDTQLKRVNRIAVLPPGAHFSEFSVLNRSQKTASAFAYADCELMSLKGESFLNVLNKFPSVATHLCDTLAKINQNLSQTHVSIEDYRSSHHEFHREIPNILPMHLWEKLRVIPLNYKAGTLTLAMTHPQDKKVYERLRGVNPNLHIVVTIIAESDFDFTLQNFKEMYKPQKIVQTRSLASESLAEEDSPIDLKSFLKQTPLFKFLSDYILDQIVPLFEVQEFKAGEYVFRANETCDDLYLIYRGEVLITKSLDDVDADVHLVTLKEGKAFGEICLITNTVHIHVARSLEKTRLFKLRKSVFDQLLKAPSFAVPVARDLAHRLQVMNEKHGLEIFQEREELQVEELSKLLPDSVIQQHKVLPLVLKDEELVVGIVNSENETIYSIISRYFLNYRIRLVLISEEQFRNWNQSINSNENMRGVVGRPKVARTRPQMAKIPDEQIGDRAVKLYEEILLEGFNKNASDLHIEPFPEAYNVRYRIDGVLVERQQKVERPVGEAIVNKIKVVSSLDISEKHLPQDGQLSATINGINMKARVSTAPTKHGENAVLRLIKQKSAVIPLNMLAPDRHTINLLKHVTEFKQGLFLITGPTGSGKTTTLYSLLNELNRVDVNIITLENPVEMDIDGITQIEMDEKTGLDFEKALRSVLRQDPDIVMVGEIRDAESAQIVFHAAMTGHLVLSTLHTNNSMEVFQRLQEMGISTINLASGMIGAVAQRLLRAVCKKCRQFEPIQPHEIEIFKNELGIIAPKELMKGRGCPACHSTGYAGRIPVYEIWRKTKEMQDVLAKGGSLGEQNEAARLDGFLTMRQFALKMVLNGLTTVEEVKRCLVG